MRFDSPFGAEPEGLSRFRALLCPEDLNFHRSQSAVIDRGQPLPRTYVSCHLTEEASIPTAPHGGYRGRTPKPFGGSFFAPVPHFPRASSVGIRPTAISSTSIVSMDPRVRRDSSFCTGSRERYVRTMSPVFL